MSVGAANASAVPPSQTGTATPSPTAALAAVPPPPSGAAQPAAPAQAAPEAAKPPAEDAAAKAEKARFEALAKRERGLVLKQTTLKQQEEALKAREAELDAKHAAKLSRLDELEKKLARGKLDPLAYLEAAGISYEELTEAKLSGAAPATLQARAARDEVEALRAQLAKDKADLEARQAKERQESEARSRKQAEEEQAETARQLQADVTDYVRDAGEKYELINLYRAHGLVVEQLWTQYRSTGRLPSYDQAAEAVEKRLDEDLQRGTKTKKWLARAAAPETPKPNAPAQHGTLNNDLTASTPSARAPIRSEAERVQRALAAAAQAEAAASARRQ